MLVELLGERAGKVRLRLALMMVLSGVANAGVILIINECLHSESEIGLESFATFWLAYLLYTYSLRVSTNLASRLFEDALYRLRCRIVDKIRGATLQGLEELGPGEIYTRVTQSISFISNSTWTIAYAIHAAVIISFIVLYVVSISKHAALLMACFYGIGGVTYYWNRRRIKALILRAAADQITLFNVLSDLIRGTKEVKLRAQRGDELLADVKEMTVALQTAPIEINRLHSLNYVTLRLYLFALLAMLVVIVPLFIPMSLAVLHSLLVVLLFMFVPLNSALRALPEYERATTVAASIYALEQRLERAAAVAPLPDSPPLPPVFHELSAKNLCFRHRDPSGQPGFSVGPFNFSIRSGEIIFFVGGNGSGKTTLLKLLTSLYSPSSGSLLLDGVPIGPKNASSYRELFAAIFTDFHLFSRLYGLSDVSPADVNSLLDRMQLSSRTSFSCIPDTADSGRFSTQNLSTGQRKRLAMIVALLEDRPIYVFDEWAADQDPEFRRFYYQELLPDLKRRGKTVLAISHDDRYFHCADRVFTLEYGTIRPS